MNCMPLWKCNRQVDYVDKRHCNLIVVPDEILRYVKTLEELMLDSNQIKDLPKGLYRLIMLRKLTMSDNEITRLSSDIGLLTNLQELDVSRNDIGDIPETIGLCRSLQVVDVSSNPLQRLPDGFTQLHNLTHAGLSDISLNRLPADTGSLASLESMELRDNLLKTLPASMSSLTKLRVLDLGSNLLEDLPDAVGRMPSLEELLLDSNELGYMPREIGNLRRLAQLDLSENQLTKLPEEIGGLANLTDLLLSQNQLEYLPDSIGSLKRLSILKVDQNQILHLTSNIGNCQSLQELVLTENLLPELPVTVGKLKMLTILNVDRNRLSVLPSEIGRCTKLGVLSVRDNHIHTLPPDLGNLKQLRVLDVSGNRLHHLPLNLGACSLKAIWLSENQAQPLLKFQTDIDEETGEKVLTCFLLPQIACQTESMENLLRNVSTDSRQSWSEQPTRISAVQFQDDVIDHENKPAGSFVRQNTPFPRDLKTKFVKPPAKSIDGHVVHHNPNKLTSFMPQRNSDVPILFSDAGQNTVPSTAINRGAPATRGNAVFVPPPHVTAGRESAAGDESEEETDEEEEEDDDDDDGSVEEPAENNRQSNGRHIGFSTETAEQTTSSFRRRDTPHHLKQSRVKSELNGQDAGDRLRQMIAQNPALVQPVAAAHGSVPPAPASTSDEESSSEDEPMNSAAVVNTNPTSRPASLSFVKISAEPEMNGDSAASVEVEMEEVEEELVLRVVRPPGTGLGISIAGGVGATPYSGDDEGVFLSKVNEVGPSCKAGLHPGDKLIMVNGHSLVGATHHAAVDVLKEAGNDVTMIVARLTKKPKASRRRPARITSTSSRNRVQSALSPTATDAPQPAAGDVDSQRPAMSPAQPTVLSANQSLSPEPSNRMSGTATPLYEVIETVLQRGKKGLGFSIAGGVGSQPYIEADEAVYISRVNEGGAAAVDGKLAVGDRIISINGENVLGVTHEKAVSLLKSQTDVAVVVQRVITSPSTSPDRSSYSGSSPRHVTPEKPSTPTTRSFINTAPAVASGDGENKSRSSVSPLLKQPVLSPTRAAETDVSVARRLVGSKNEEDEEESESESETDEGSSDEESTTPFIEYDAEPLSKSRTQSRSTTRSITDNADTQRQPPKPKAVSPSPVELKSPVATMPNRSPVTSASPVVFSRSSPVVITEQGFAGRFPRSPDRGSRSEEFDLKSPVTAAPERISMSSMSSVDRVSQPSPVVNTESAYVRKSPQSPAVHSMVPSVEPDYARKFERPPTVRSPVAYAEPVDAFKFDRFPATMANAEPVYAGKSRGSLNYARMSPPQLEYAQFDSEPMSRNRRNIPYADDDELPPAPLPGSPRKPSSPPVITPTLSTTPAPPITPLVAQPNFVQTFEAPSVMAPRAAVGPILMPPAASESVGRIEASPVLHIRQKPSSQDNRRSSEMPAAHVRPSSVSRMSPHPPSPHAETSADAVSQLFMKLESNYTDAPPPSRIPVRIQEPSYGPGYRPPTHGAVVRQQEPYPVETVVIHKAGGPLGLSIVGGADHSSHPFGVDEPGVFVSKISVGGAASRASLRVGDRILAVNGNDVRRASHQEAVTFLIAPVQDVYLTVRHDPSPAGLQDLVVHKNPGEKLGIGIRGGTSSQFGNPFDKTDEGIFISRIMPNGAVARDGRLCLGQRILEVNGQSLLGCSHQDAVNALRSVGSDLVISVCNGFDPSVLSSLEGGSPSANRNSVIRYNSQSSVDRDSYDDRQSDMSLERQPSAQRTPPVSVTNELVLSKPPSDVQHSQTWDKPQKPPVASKPWKASPVSGIPVPVAQPVRGRSSSLTRSATPQSNGSVVVPDSPRSDIVVKSRRPSGGLPSSSDQQPKLTPSALASRRKFFEQEIENAQPVQPMMFQRPRRDNSSSREEMRNTDSVKIPTRMTPTDDVVNGNVRYTRR